MRTFEHYTPKLGISKILVDEEDAHLFENRTIRVWTSKRHNSVYAFLFDPKTKELTRLHRLIMQPKVHEVVDHINGNALDNRKQNLRITTQRGNNKNAAKRRNAKTSKYKGVHFSKVYKNKPWIAQIQVDGKKQGLGYYVTEREAAEAYNRAAIQFFGEYAKLNET